MMAINIANALSDKGFESYLCATRLEGDLKPKLSDKVNYIYVGRRKVIDIAALKKIRKFITRHRIEIIHAHSSSYLFSALIKFFHPTIQIVWHDHFGDFERLGTRKRQPLKFFSKYFKAVISVNHSLKQWSEQNLKVKEIVYIPNFAELQDSNSTTKLSGEKGKRIVCLAAFRPQKDHLNLLNAFIEVSEKNENWTLHLVGNHSEDEYFNSVLQFIEENELIGKVFLYHNSTDVKNILTQSDIGVLSSKSEGLPVSLLEYGYVGLPVISTNVGECNSVLGNGKFGLVVEPSNSKELSESIIKMIESEELRTTFGRNFKIEIHHRYNKNIIIEQIIDIYNS